MLKIIFTRIGPDGEGNCKVGEVPSTEAADAKMMSMFVDFCRDVSHGPLMREHYANGFEWTFKGIKYALHYESKEVS